MRFRLHAVAVVCAAFFLSFVAVVQTARAQDITGRLIGTVTDTTGAVIRGASVVVRNEATGVSRPPITTDSSGHWVADSLPVGTYSIFVTAQGFKTASVSGKSVTVDGRLNVDVAMETWTAPKMGLGPITNIVSEGRLSGTVTDVQGVIIVGARVAITNDATHVSRPPITTNSSGFWEADDLPVGSYTVTVTAKGYKTTKSVGNSVTAGGRFTADAVMEPGTSADPPVIITPAPPGSDYMYTGEGIRDIVPGSIIGTVTDPHGDPIVKAKVTIANKATGVKHRTITSQDGMFMFEKLDWGTYTVTIKAKRFHTATVKANIAASDDAATVDVVMHR